MSFRRRKGIKHGFRIDLRVTDVREDDLVVVVGPADMRVVRPCQSPAEPQAIEVDFGEELLPAVVVSVEALCDIQALVESDMFDAGFGGEEVKDRFEINRSKKEEVVLKNEHEFRLDELESVAKIASEVPPSRRKDALGVGPACHIPLKAS